MAEYKQRSHPGYRENLRKEADARKPKTLSVANNAGGSTKQGSAKRNRYMGATNMGKSIGPRRYRRDSQGRFA